MEERTLQLFLGKTGNKWSKVREWGEAEGDSVEGGWRELTRHHPLNSQATRDRFVVLFCFLRLWRVFSGRGDVSYLAPSRVCHNTFDKRTAVSQR